MRSRINRRRRRDRAVGGRVGRGRTDCVGLDPDYSSSFLIAAAAYTLLKLPAPVSGGWTQSG